MNPDDFRRLVAAGLTTEQVAIVMEMMARDAAAVAAADEARKAKGRNRIARWREGRNVTATQPNVTVRLAPVEDKTSNLDIEPQEKKQNTAARGVSEFRSKLSTHLDADLLDAFIAVRKAKRGAMTGYAADLFVGDAQKCGMSVPDAARECVRSSWITVKPEYFAGRPRAGPAVKVSPIDHFLKYASEIDGKEPDSRSGGSNRDDAPGVPIRAIQHHG